MFNATEVVIGEFQEYLRACYRDAFGLMEPEYPNIIAFIARLSLENIANTDAPYHDMEHTIRVTDCGQTILKGKHLLDGGITPSDWLHVTIALLLHDIGYVRGVLPGDSRSRYIIDAEGTTVALGDDITDASLSMHHLNRSKLFVSHWFASIPEIEVNRLLECIEMTRFPVPKEPFYQQTDTLAGLVRAADLIGQMGDISYRRKTAALHREIIEAAADRSPLYATAHELRKNYPAFFWNVVSPLIQPALRYLNVTQEGKMWSGVLFSHVFAAEHMLG